MKRFLLAFSALFILSSLFFNVQAQEKDNGVYTPSSVKERKPLQFQNVREADVIYSKTLWRWVDLVEKSNLPLYYPVDDMPRRKSLLQVIMDGLENSSIKAYRSDDFDNKQTLSITEVKEQMGAGVRKQPVKTIWGDDSIDINGNQVFKEFEEDPRADEVKALLIKEKWFFDKQRSVMDVRVVGFCFIRIFKKEGATQLSQSDLFWIKYKDARAPLVHTNIYTPGNEDSPLTFDDFLLKRMYSGYVFKEDNVYENRMVNEYTSGENILLESDEILNRIYNTEQSVWEY